MIMRIWKGRTAEAHADEYLEYLQQTGLREYRETEGNLGAVAVRRATEDGLTEFVTMSFWRDMPAIKAFAGADPEVAVFYPQDDEYLVEADPSVRHYEVADASWPRGSSTPTSITP